ncbi:hypothetical protein [Phyllobacterium phragmitis]|uniref:Uncharacterized protein n=1 Tax=Phyllobacterium phragmitis TaxID=2670329 RepID=A0ABQ0H768_9HYPH
MNVQNLSLPRLFQAPGQVLDLQKLNPPDPHIQGDQGDPVVVSVLLPDASEDTVTVWFGSVQKQFPIPNPKLVVLDCLFQRNELPPAGATYEVYYEYGGQQSPYLDIQLIDSSSHTAIPRHSFTACGMWAAATSQIPTPVDAWLLPIGRILLKDDPVIKPVTEKTPDEDVTLKIVRKPSGGSGREVGEVIFDQAQAQWSVNLYQESLTLQEADLLLVQNSEETTQFLGFSMTW